MQTTHVCSSNAWNENEHEKKVMLCWAQLWWKNLASALVHYIRLCEIALVQWQSTIVLRSIPKIACFLLLPPGGRPFEKRDDVLPDVQRSGTGAHPRHRLLERQPHPVGSRRALRRQCVSVDSCVPLFASQ